MFDTVLIVLGTAITVAVINELTRRFFTRNNPALYLHKTEFEEKCKNCSVRNLEKSLRDLRDDVRALRKDLTDWMIRGENK